MFAPISLADFLAETVPGRVRVLFIHEYGCRHCEAAETEFGARDLAQEFPAVEFRSVAIDDEPGVASALGLVGVPAFLRIDGSGRKRLRTGFGDYEGWRDFVRG